MTDEQINEIAHRVIRNSMREAANNADELAGMAGVATMTGPEALRFFAETLRKTNE